MLLWSAGMPRSARRASKGESQIPAHTTGNDGRFEVPPFEQGWSGFAHQGILSGPSQPPQTCNTSVMFMFPSNHPNYFLQTKMSLACARVLKGCGCGVRGEPLLPVLVVANSSRIRCRYQRLRACRRVECRVNFSIVVQHDPAM